MHGLAWCLSAGTAFAGIAMSGAVAQVPTPQAMPATPAPATDVAPEAATPDAPAAATGQIQDIIVTAQRREESLQRVPISVTALTTAGLEQKQVADVVALAKVVPGLQTKPTLTPLEISVAIRGVTQLIPSINVDPAIGTYVDGIYSVVNAGSNTALIDMERVEVLKGPQGTLFGRNTIGGAISITTAKPKDEWGGYIDGSYGNYDAWSGTAVLNVPIAPGIAAARLVYQHSQHDGYGRNFTTGNPIGTFNQDFVRGSLKLTPTDRLRVDLTGSYVDAKGFGFPTNLASFDPSAALAPGIPPTNFLVPLLGGKPGDLLTNYIGRKGGQDSFSNRDSRFALRQYGFTGTATYEVSDAVSIRSITGYTNTRYNTVQDLDGTPYVILELVAYPIRARQFSQELQVFGDALDGRLKWIGGGYYFQVKGGQFSNATVLASLTGPNINVGGPSVSNKSYSGFAQLTYEIAPGLRLTAGARYVKDTRRVAYADHVETPGGANVSCNLANAPGDTNDAKCLFAHSAKFDYVPFTAGIDYQPNGDTLLYAKVSKGFRSGAFTLSGPTATQPGPAVTPAQAAAANANALSVFGAVSPERLISPEIGGKFQLFDRRVRLNLAAYYSSYSNIQQTVNADNPAGCTSCTPPAILSNSGTAHIYGFEAESTLLLGKLQLDGTLGYTHPKYVSGVAKGTPVINVAKLNGSLTGSYPIELAAGTVTLTGTYSYRSRLVNYSLSPGLSPTFYDTFTQKSFSLVDARVSYAVAGAPLTISAFGQNLFNKRYIAAGTSFGAPLLFTSNSPGAPRTYGVSARYTF